MVTLIKALDPQSPAPYSPLGDEARKNHEQFITNINDDLYEQLAECIRAASSQGARGLEVFVYNAAGDEEDGRCVCLANPDETGVRDLAEVHINLSAVSDWERLANRLNYEGLTLVWSRHATLGDVISSIYWE